MKDARAVELSRVKEIRQLHAEIGEALRTTLPKAIRVGELLAAQKAELKHGEWIPWLEKNCPFSERTAQDYMRFHARRADLKSAPGADIREARKLLAALPPGGKITARPVKVRDMRAALTKTEPEPPPFGEIAHLFVRRFRFDLRKLLGR